jgi:hypothetical protein
MEPSNVTKLIPFHCTVSPLSVIFLGVVVGAFKILKGDFTIFFMCNHARLCLRL